MNNMDQPEFEIDTTKKRVNYEQKKKNKLTCGALFLFSILFFAIVRVQNMLGNAVSQRISTDAISPAKEVEIASGEQYELFASVVVYGGLAFVVVFTLAVILGTIGLFISSDR